MISSAHKPCAPQNCPASISGRAGVAVAHLAMLFALAATIATGGCTTLPSNGPNHFAIDRQASESLTVGHREVVEQYVLLDIARPVLDHMDEVGPESLFTTFGTGRGSAPELRIGRGDVLNISIFESSGGGLFLPGDVGTRPGNYLTLPPQSVDAKGEVTVPYAGAITAAGRTVPAIQKDIEARLSKRAIEPQVIISLQSQTANEVAIFGDATGNSKTVLQPGGERVLDVIAKAGLKIPGFETFVTLQRKNSKATIYFPLLVRSPKENIYVRPGDVLYAYREQQKYVAVGALGNISQTQGLTGQFAFESEKLTLAEAVAKAGGLLDTRAAASQVFLYRREHRKTLEDMGVSLSKFPADMKFIPTIYRANFRDPSVFFFTQEFRMRNRDIIYVANADAVEVEKFFGFVNTVTGGTAAAATDALTIGNPGGVIFGR